MTVYDAALAWGLGSDVQIRLINGSWVSIPKPGQPAIQKSGWLLGANQFNVAHNAGPFRIAPEPATGSIIPPSPPPITDPVYRPWTFEEVPLGAEVCLAGASGRVVVSEIIVGRHIRVINELRITHGRNESPARFLLDAGYLWSLNGSPWRRCGVEIQTASPCQSP